MQDTFYGSLQITDDRDIFQGANPPEVRLQFNAGHSDARITFRNLK